MATDFKLPDITDHLGEIVEDARFCNFFDADGNGPDHVYMTDECVNNIAHDKAMRELCPNTYSRNFMLSFDRSGLDCAVTDFKAGGYTLSEDGARWLIGRLTAWLDAPRLAARANPEIVAAEVIDPHDCALPVIALVRTSAGEWGVGCAPSLTSGIETAGDSAPDWFTGDRAEHDARSLYAQERDMSYCGECKREVDGDLHQLGEDGPDACEDCHAEARAEWLASDVVCAAEGCGWSGRGAEADNPHGEGPECPKCGAEIEEV